VPAIVFRVRLFGIPTSVPSSDPGSSLTGFLVDSAALKRVFSEYFDFPCHSFIPQIGVYLSLSSMGGTIDQ
jgi:hypothetical protein